MKIIAAAALLALAPALRAECPDEAAMRSVAQSARQDASLRALLPGTQSDAERRAYARIFLHLRGRNAGLAPLTGTELHLSEGARRYFAAAFSCSLGDALPGIDFRLPSASFSTPGDVAAFAPGGAGGEDSSRFREQTISDRLRSGGLALFPQGVEGVPDQFLPRVFSPRRPNCPDDMGDSARRACRRAGKGVRVGTIIPF